MSRTNRYSTPALAEPLIRVYVASTVEFWSVPREIILTMRTFTADLNSKLIGLEVNRAHMSTYIHQKRRRHRVMSIGTRRRLPNTIQNQYPTANLPTMR